jgi:hypothetical protein
LCAIRNWVPKFLLQQQKSQKIRVIRAIRAKEKAQLTMAIQPETRRTYPAKSFGKIKFVTLVNNVPIGPLKEVVAMQSSLKQMDRVDLINIDRLAHIIRGLSQVELETLEILLDKEATDTINGSIKELKKGERISISEW